MACPKILSKLVKSLRCAFHTSSWSWDITSVSKQISVTAGIIVIGDEILKGQTYDTNSNFIAKNLTELGVKVKKVSVIGDNLDEISDEVRHFSEQFTYVITTGGIGSTHDDITYEGVARAFGETTELNPEILRIIKGLYKDKDLTSAVLKFASVPKSAKLTYGFDEVRGRRTLFPSVSVRNVFIFPGIPNLMERLFKAVHKELFGKGAKQLYKKDLYTLEKEIVITDHLNSIVAKFPKVTIGSYPTFFHRYYNVHLTLESEEQEEVQKAFSALREGLPECSLVDYDPYPLQDAYQKIIRLAEKDGKKIVLSSIKQLEQCCEEYQLDDICMYLDGGKETIAALHLYHACVRKNDINACLRGFYVPNKTVLPETDVCIRETMWRYSVLGDIYEESLEASVTKLLSDNAHIKVIIIAHPLTDTRTDDEEHLLKVTSAHPEVKWINVLKDWNSQDVSDFVRSLYLPYCPTSVH